MYYYANIIIQGRDDKVKKINKIIITLLLIISSCFILYLVKNDTNNISSVIYQEAENLKIENGYYLDLYTNGNENIERNGLIEFDNNTTLNAVVKNIGKERNFMIKLYLNYEEISFFIDDLEYKNYEFSIGESKSITIPLKLKNINPLTNSKLTVFLIASPEISASDINELPTDSYGIVLDYFLSVNNTTENVIELNQNSSNADIYFEEPFYTFVINNDFSESNEAKYPPNSLKVSQGETVELAYRIGADITTDKVLLCLNVGWKQTAIDNQPYKIINIQKDKACYGTFTIKAPNKPGKYEISSFLVENPNEWSEYVPLRKSLRFTLEVE